MPLALMLNPKAATSEDEQSRVPALRSGPRMRSRQVNRCTTIASTTHHVLRNILHACGIHVRGSYRGSRARVHHRHLTVGNEVARADSAPAPRSCIKPKHHIASVHASKHLHRESRSQGRRTRPSPPSTSVRVCGDANVLHHRGVSAQSASRSSTATATGSDARQQFHFAAGPSRLRRHNRRNRGDPGNGAVVPGPW